MASLRRLNRRLRVWQRYDARYQPPGEHDLHKRPVNPARGHTRLVARITDEQIRRGWWYQTRFDCLGDCCRDGGDEDDFYDGEGYPWPGVVVEHAFAERGLL
jgi:hypothetical protein